MWGGLMMREEILLRCSFFGQNTELHAVWDTAIIQRYNPQWQALSAELQATIKANSTLIPQYTKNMDPVDWADESFGYTRTQVYVGVTGTNPNLTDSYYDRNLPLIKQRLIAAGIRRGTLLNTTFH